MRKGTAAVGKRLRQRKKTEQLRYLSGERGYVLSNHLATRRAFNEAQSPSVLITLAGVEGFPRSVMLHGFMRSPESSAAMAFGFACSTLAKVSAVTLVPTLLGMVESLLVLSPAARGAGRVATVVRGPPGSPRGFSGMSGDSAEEVHCSLLEDGQVAGRPSVCSLQARAQGSTSVYHWGVIASCGGLSCTWVGSPCLKVVCPGRVERPSK